MPGQAEAQPAQLQAMTTGEWSEQRLLWRVSTAGRRAAEAEDQQVTPTRSMEPTVNTAVESTLVPTIKCVPRADSDSESSGMRQPAFRKAEESERIQLLGVQQDLPWGFTAETFNNPTLSYDPTDVPRQGHVRRSRQTAWDRRVRRFQAKPYDFQSTSLAHMHQFIYKASCGKLASYATAMKTAKAVKEEQLAPWMGCSCKKHSTAVKHHTSRWRETQLMWRQALRSGDKTLVKLPESVNEEWLELDMM